MGDPVRVVTTSGAIVLVRAYGPDIVTPSPGPNGRPPDHAFGTFTISVAGISGSALSVAAGDFVVRDDLGKPESVVSELAHGTAAPGSTAQFRLQGTLGVGHATLTWEPGGSPLVVWDFTVELD